jgi:putative FmdB family regulatory protein
MPLYDYDCSACGRRFEVVHGLYAERPTVCPICGSGPIRKAISAAAVHFKGSGWAKKERRTAVASGTSKKGSGDGDGSDGGAKTDDAAKTGEAGASSSDGAGSSATATKPVESGTASKAEISRRSDTTSRAG